MLNVFRPNALSQTDMHALTGGHKETRPDPSRGGGLGLSSAQQILVLQTQQTGLQSMLTVLQGFVPTDGTTASTGLTNRIAKIQEELKRIQDRITKLSTTTTTPAV